MDIAINAHSLLVFIVAVFVGSFAVVMYCGSKNISARIFAVGAGLYSIWATNIGLLISTQDKIVGQFLSKFSYFFGSVIASIYLIFFCVFPNENRFPKKIIYLTTVIEIAFFISYFFTNLMLGEFKYDENLKFWTWILKPPAAIFDLYFLSVFMFGIVSLRNYYKRELDYIRKKNLLYVLISVVAGIVPPAIFDISLHWFGVFKFNWVGPITGVIWVMVLGYSILKYQQMDIRLAFSEMFVVAMNVIFFVNIFLNVSLGIFGRVTLAIVFCLFGYKLIRFINRDNERREQVIDLNNSLADLNQNLAQKVEAQTKEIRKAYEVEKRAKEEIEKLDQNKSDFIIITQHHLRTPLSQIRWYLDSIANGLYGQISNEVSGAIENTTKITARLYKILNHFLDISRLKVGHKILNLEATNIKFVIESSLHELRNDLKNRSISVEFSGIDWPELNCDAEKIKDVILIILDNAIKYNQETGTIIVKGINSKRNFIVSISNTGLVFNKVDLESIFQDTFYRSADAKKVNPTGMGVSLLVARTIMHAHKGSISLDMDDKGLSCVSLQFKKL